MNSSILNFYLPLLLFCISSSVTPGPNNLMMMTSGTHHGIKRSLPHYLGICLGFPLMVLCIALGLGAIFSDFPILHQVIKILGSIYLLYLAYKIIRTSNSVADKQGTQKPWTFLRAMLFQWINPKAWIMVVGAVSAYTMTGVNMYQQAALITFMFFIVGIPCVGIWLLGGAAMRKYLKSPRHLLIFNTTMGILLALSVLLIYI